MFRTLRKGIDKFEREWNHDTSHRRDMIDASPRAAWLFSRVTDLLAVAAEITRRWSGRSISSNTELIRCWIMGEIEIP